MSGRTKSLGAWLQWWTRVRSATRLLHPLWEGQIVWLTPFLATRRRRASRGASASPWTTSPTFGIRSMLNELPYEWTTWGSGAAFAACYGPPRRPLASTLPPSMAPRMSQRLAH